jgi:dolichol-phosphate mannosyltransferase
LNSTTTRFIIRRRHPRQSKSSDDPCPEGESLKDPALAEMHSPSEAASRGSPVRLGWAAALAPLADVLIFIAISGAGEPVNLAHIVSFGCATLVNYFFSVRTVVAWQGRKRDLRLYAHLLLVALVALFLRAGVLSLLIGWGLPSQWAIVFAAAAAAAVVQAGNSLCLTTGTWSLGSGVGWRALAVSLIVCAALLRLIYSSQMELLPEEAYYWNYSRHLAPGYLDHPPMVAWLIRLGTSLFGNTEIGIRFGAMCSAAVASYFVYRLTRNLFDETSAWVALVLMQLLPFFFFTGFLMTPDAPLTAAWAALLYFLERALIADRLSAWLWAGVSLGLGLLAKYTIAMLVPAMLAFMIWDAQARHWLRHWAPYAAGVLGLLIFSPVIFWNATHEWASFAFQTSRRLAEAPRFSLHKLILSTLILLTPVGVVSLVSGNAVRANRQGRFLLVAILAPFIVFFFFSLRHEVKFDWTGASWLAAVPALASAVVNPAAGRVAAWVRRAWVPTLLVLLLIYGAAFHYLVLGFPGLGYSKHMELVPVGWRAMGQDLAEVAADVRRSTGTELLVVGLDRYELASELAFYAPDHARSVSQTSSGSLFGGVGLMYSLWFPAQSARGRNLLLVGWDAQDLDKEAIRARVARLGPIQEGVLTRNGQPVRHYYYRFAYGYEAAPFQ